MSGLLEPVVHVFVIRVKMGAACGLPAMRILAHSGLLLVTASGAQYILEYGVGKNHLVSLSPQPKPAALDAEAFVDASGTRWDKQRRGSALARAQQPTVVEARDTMWEAMGAGPYDVFSHNCHCAQERTRGRLGLAVANAYEGSGVQRALQALSGDADPVADLAADVERWLLAMVVDVGS